MRVRRRERKRLQHEAPRNGDAFWLSCSVSPLLRAEARSVTSVSSVCESGGENGTGFNTEAPRNGDAFWLWFSVSPLLCVEARSVTSVSSVCESGRKVRPGRRQLHVSVADRVVGRRAEEREQFGDDGGLVARVTPRPGAGLDLHEVARCRRADQ